MIRSFPQLLRRTALAALLACALPAGNMRGAENISPLGQSPAWASLEPFQETMTHDEFAESLQNVYCPRGVPAEFIQLDTNEARFLVDKDEQRWFTLRFASNEGSRKAVALLWKRAASLPTAPKGRELTGVKIALDPGHIGGTWAQMEERWFQVGDSKPIQEGDMTLRVAQLIAPKLRKLGATVSLVREKLAPVTPKRPDDMKDVSQELLRRAGVAQPREDFAGSADPEKENTIRWQN